MGIRKNIKVKKNKVDDLYKRTSNNI
jgi:hypothetical protein